MHSNIQTQLGFKIWDVNCQNPSASDITKMKQALWQNGVICIKKQDLTPEQLVNLTGKFGEVIIRPSYYANEFRMAEYPAIIRVGNVDLNGSPSLVPKDAELWHKDGSFEQPGNNFILSFLYPKVFPQTGGNTGFVDSNQVFECLSNELIQQLKDCKFIMSSKTSSFFANVVNEEQLAPDAHHQIIQTHPISQVPLFCLTHNDYPILLPSGERITQPQLIEQIEQNYSIYSHKWEEGDIVIWDNLRVIHKGMGGYGNQERLFFRTQCRVQDHA